MDTSSKWNVIRDALHILLIPKQFKTKAAEKTYYIKNVLHFNYIFKGEIVWEDTQTKLRRHDFSQAICLARQCIANGNKSTK